MPCTLFQEKVNIMNIIKTDIEGVVIIEPKVFGDAIAEMLEINI